MLVQIKPHMAPSPARWTPFGVSDPEPGRLPLAEAAVSCTRRALALSKCGVVLTVRLLRHGRGPRAVFSSALPLTFNSPHEAGSVILDVHQPMTTMFVAGVWHGAALLY